jgi:hypothetical protein
VDSKGGDLVADDATVETYFVSGSTPFQGHEPGDTFDAELAPELRARAIARGSIKVLGDEDGEDEFKSLSRADLNALAVREGVEEPDKLPNMDAVIAAVQAAREGKTDGGDE